jgi:hypothetical protein
MSDLDTKIRKALTDMSDANVSLVDGEDPDENSIYEDILTAYTTKYKYFIAIAWLKLIAAMAVWAFCVYQFFHQEEIKVMIAYASGAIMCSVVIAAIAVYFWQEVNKHIFSREIKRLELQIALLIKHIKSSS